MAVRRWLLLHLFGLKYGSITLPNGAVIMGPAVIEGFGVTVRGPEGPGIAASEVSQWR